jgi:ATP-dependent protease ClpP protease subunit
MNVKRPSFTNSSTIEKIEEYLSPAENEDILVEKNRIYFYGDVDRQNVLKLCNEIYKLENALLIMTQQYNLQEPPSIFLHIASDGGCVYSGLSAMDSIKACKVPVVTIVDGFLASAATFIFLGGHTKKMKKHSNILIHQIQTEFWGKYNDLVDEMTNSKNIMTMIKRIYKEESALPMKMIDNIINKELNLSPIECLKYKIIDEII